jgi:hypothetical protein
MQLCFCIISVHEEYLNSALALPSRTQSLKAAIVFDRHSKDFIEKRIKPPEFNKNSKIFG